MSSPITKEADSKASAAVLTATRIDEIDVINTFKNTVLTITSTILATYLANTQGNSDKGLVA